MIRVAFPLNFSDRSWMGGVNYFHNLFEALRLAPSSQIESVIIAGASADREILTSIGADEMHLCQWGDVSGWRWKLRRLLTLGLDRDPVFERQLKKQHISLLSHMGYMGKGASIPSLTWVPDFQERYLPEFFSAAELAARDKENRRIARHASAILLSSEYARQGLAEISQAAAASAFVLPFVASVPRLSDIPSREELEVKYGTLGNYFFLPNQFWAHKNHQVVIRALGLLRRQGKSVTVVATGNPQDHRQPEHGKYLMQMIAEEKVEDDFCILGMVPYKDLMGLMAHAIALINPSLFEGWSTTVEEAKSLGKMALISDIPVHREQSPTRACYFNHREPEELSAALIELVGDYSQEQELTYMRQSESEFLGRREAFAHRYEEIVCSVVNEGRNV